MVFVVNAYAATWALVLVRLFKRVLLPTLGKPYKQTVYISLMSG